MHIWPLYIQYHTFVHKLTRVRAGHWFVTDVIGGGGIPPFCQTNFTNKLFAKEGWYSLGGKSPANSICRPYYGSANFIALLEYFESNRLS